MRKVIRFFWYGELCAGDLLRSSLGNNICEGMRKAGLSRGSYRNEMYSYQITHLTLQGTLMLRRSFNDVPSWGQDKPLFPCISQCWMWAASRKRVYTWVKQPHLAKGNSQGRSQLCGPSSQYSRHLAEWILHFWRVDSEQWITLIPKHRPVKKY